MVNQVQQVASVLGGLGRYGDTYMVHAAEGETIIPMEVLDQSPILKKRLFKQMRKMGIEPERYIVGNQLNSLNPITGQPEFFLKKIFKKAKETVARVMPGDTEKYLGPIVAAMTGRPYLAALAGGLGGGDALKSGIMGAMLPGISGMGGQAGSFLDYFRGLAPGKMMLKGVASSLSPFMNPLEKGQELIGKGLDTPLSFLPNLGQVGDFFRGIPYGKIGRTFNPFAKAGETFFGPAGERGALAKWGPAAAGILGLTALASGKGDKRRPGSLIDYDASQDPLINLISGNQQYVDWLKALGLPVADQDIYQEEGIGLPVGAQGGIVKKYAEGSGPFGVHPGTEERQMAMGPDEGAGPMTPLDPRYFTDEDNYKLDLEGLDPSGSLLEMLEELEISGASKRQMIEMLVGKGVAPQEAVALVMRKKVAQGGIIQGYQAGGFPRRTGAISGPGTGTSDSVPAMLSDGEFVMTADAVRNAGGGDRRVGAQKMYNLMNRLEGGMV